MPYQLITCLQFLVCAAKLKVNERDEKKETPLSLAVQNKLETCFEFLLEHKAKITKQ